MFFDKKSVIYPHSHAFNVKRIISHSNLELVLAFFSPTLAVLWYKVQLTLLQNWLVAKKEKKTGT